MDNKSGRAKEIIKFFVSAICLLMVFAYLFSVVSDILVQPEDDRSYSMIESFYDEGEDSLDVVFLGSSISYTNLCPYVAWKNYGITTYSLATPAQPFPCQEYFCREARKTQPNALYIFNLVPICEYFDDDKPFGYHSVVDYMPFSVNKLKMTYVMCKNAGFSYKESAEYFVPLVRYHDTWETWDGVNRNKPLDGVKGVPHYYKFLVKTRNVEDKFKEYDGRAELTGEYEPIKNDVLHLLNYIKEENVNAMFIISPTAGKGKTIHECINTAADMVEEAGYPVLDMQQQEVINEIGINLEKDYYNTNHLNIHGYLKTTKYISEYLVENYGFKDKRNDPLFKEQAKVWNEYYDEYLEYLTPYVIPNAYNLELDYTFLSPKLKSQAIGDGKVQLTWKADDEAEGYVIYKKEELTKPLKKLTELDGSENSFVDTEKTGTKPYYIIVAKRTKNGKTVLGDYYGKGTSVVVE